MNIENNDGLYISYKSSQGFDQLIDLVQNKLMITSDRVRREYRVLQGGQVYKTLVND